MIPQSKPPLKCEGLQLDPDGTNRSFIYGEKQVKISRCFETIEGFLSAKILVLGIFSAKKFQYRKPV